MTDVRAPNTARKRETARPEDSRQPATTLRPPAPAKRVTKSTDAVVHPERRAAPAIEEAVVPRLRPPTDVKGPAVDPLLARRLEGASAIIRDPARNVPELREGQGVVRVLDERNRNVEWRIKRIDGDNIVLEDRVRSNGTDKVMPRAQLLDLVTRQGNGRYELRETPALTAPVVRTDAMRAFADIVRQTTEYNRGQIRGALGDRDFQIYSALEARHAELSQARERENTALVGWMEQRRPGRDSATRGVAAFANWLTGAPTRGLEEMYGEAPQREPLRRIQGQLQDVERAMLSVTRGQGIDFEPKNDAITFALRQFRDSNAASPSLADRTRLNSALLADASERGRVVDGWAAYHATVQPYLQMRNPAGESFHSVGNAPSLTGAVNALIANRTIGGRQQVVTADQLLALRPQIEANWAGVVAQRHSLAGPNVSTGRERAPFDADAARQLDAEVARLRALESDPAHRELAGMVGDANSRVPKLVAGEPSWIREQGEAALRLFDRSDVVAGIGIGALTLGTGSTVLGGMGVTGSAAELVAMARAGTLSWRALATMRGAGVLAADFAVDGAAFHAGMNLYFGATDQHDKIDTSPGAFARSIAMMGVGRLAGLGHVARAAEQSPGILRAIAEHGRYFGEEAGGLGLVSAMGTALQRGDQATALHEIEANTQMLVAMRAAAAARGLYARGPRPPANEGAEPSAQPRITEPANDAALAAQRSTEVAALRTQRAEAEARRLIEEGAGRQEIDASVRRLGEAYDAELAALRPRRAGEAELPATASPSRETLLDRVYAVHSTDFFPQNGQIRPGNYMDAAHQQQWGTEGSPSFRPSVHWALGEVVREHHGGEHSWDSKQFAVVSPLRNLEPQLANVNPYDSWTVGRVQLRAGDTVVVPRGTDVSSLPREVRAHEYDPATTTLRDAVDTTIRSQNGFQFRMADNQLAWEAPAMLDGQNVNTPTFFRNLLQSRPDLSFGNHIQSAKGEGFRYGAVDQLIQSMIDPHNGVHHSGRGEYEFNRAVLDYHIGKLRSWAQEHLTPEQVGDFEQQAANVGRWADKVRSETTGSRTPTMTILTRAMFTSMSAGDIHEFQRANPNIRLPDDFWAVYSLQRRTVHPWLVPSEEGLPALTRESFGRLNRNVDLLEHLDEGLNRASPGALSRTLAVLREPAVREYLRRQEGIDLPEGQPRDLDDLLRANPRTRALYAERSPDQAVYDRLMGHEREPPESYSRAIARMRYQTEDVHDIELAKTQPMSNLRAENAIGAGQRLTLYELMRRDGPDKYFDRAGLGAQFRRAYPNPADLFRERRPLWQILAELQRS